MAMKVYGASTAGVRNGSMGFDEATLEPTYVLRLGAPGKSAGLDIAARWDSTRVIEAARARMTTTERDVSRFLAEMHQRMAALEEERAGGGGARANGGGAGAVARANLGAQVRGQDPASWSGARPSSPREFEQRAQETIGELSQKARAKIAKTRREFQEVGRGGGKSCAPRNCTPRSRSRQQLKLAEGARVRLKGIRQPATVRRLLSNGLVEVDAGFLKMQVSAADVEEVLPPADAPRRAQPVSLSARARASNVLSRDQSDRAARRGGLRAGGQVPG